MRKTLSLVVALFIASATVAERGSTLLAAVGGSNVDASGQDSLVVRELSTGVWLHTSWSEFNGVMFPKNGLLFLHQGQIWLVDTAWGNELTEDLLAWVDRELGLPIAGAIVSHFHDDSMGGTPALAARGVPSWAHPLTLQLGEGEGVPLPEPIDGLGIGDSRVIGGADVYYPGPGHSSDNIFVWLPEHRILFGGCAVRPAESSSLGNTSDAVVGEWPRAIERVKERFPDVVLVVPSHGDLGDRTLLDHTIALFGSG